MVVREPPRSAWRLGLHESATLSIFTWVLGNELRSSGLQLTHIPSSELYFAKLRVCTLPLTKCLSQSCERHLHRGRTRDRGECRWICGTSPGDSFGAWSYGNGEGGHLGPILDFICSSDTEGRRMPIQGFSGSGETDCRWTLGCWKTRLPERTERERQQVFRK